MHYYQKRYALLAMHISSRKIHQFLGKYVKRYDIKEAIFKKVISKIFCQINNREILSE